MAVSRAAPTNAGAFGVFLAVAMLVSQLPAGRAAGVAPMDTLRAS